MGEIVALAAAVLTATPKLLYVGGLAYLVLHFVDRGRQAATQEMAEESRDREAA